MTSGRRVLRQPLRNRLRMWLQPCCQRPQRLGQRLSGNSVRGASLKGLYEANVTLPVRRLGHRGRSKRRATDCNTAVGGALLGAMPGGGGTTQTGVNRLAGARIQLSEVVTAAMTLVTMMFLAPLIGLMPQATLAAVVIVYSVGLIKPAEFREILSVRRTEFMWSLSRRSGIA